jgi:hypothetical protein
MRWIFNDAKYSECLVVAWFDVFGGEVRRARFKLCLLLLQAPSHDFLLGVATSLDMSVIPLIVARLEFAAARARRHARSEPHAKTTTSRTSSVKTALSSSRLGQTLAAGLAVTGAASCAVHQRCADLGDSG